MNGLQAQTLDSLVKNIVTTLKSATIEEVVAALLVPVLATFIGHYFTRHLERQQASGPLSQVIHFLVPLIVPAFALGFAAMFITLLREQGTESLLLVFVLKLAAAWLAWRFMRRMIEKRIAGWFIAIAFIPITILKLFGLLDVTIDLLASLRFEVGSVELNAYQVVKGIIALMALQWLAHVTLTVLDNRLQAINDLRASNRALIMKIISIFIYCFVFIFALQILGINLTALGVFGGALGIGVGFGLRGIASNFIAGVILLFEKSLEVGDMIEMQDGTTGFVRQTYARYTRLEMQTGREFLIPNEELVNQRVISWTHTHKKAQIEIPVHVGYDADVALARDLMIKAAEESRNRLPNSDIECNVSAFNERGVEIKLQFWVRDVTRGRSGPRSDVMIAILNSFNANKIAIPYPQRQVHVVNDGGSNSIAFGGDA